MTRHFALCQYAYMKTLQEILAPYGIRSSHDLALACDMGEQQANDLWKERRNIGKKVALRISKGTGCPPAVLLFYREAK